VKINDTVVGVALIALAITILVHIQAYPLIPGQKYGPALFPGLIAVGFIATGGLLVARGVKSGGPLFTPGAWMRAPALVTNFLAVCAALALYVLAVDALGFIPTGVVILLALFLKFGVRPLAALATAVATTLVMHWLFYKLLKVPLPWGILERFAW
jgi:putative tricarboxylic transport membrane protein